MQDKPVSVDAYLSALPEDQRLALEQLRATIKAAAPNADEAIAYAMPAFKYRGRPLVYFGAARHHVAIYGLVPEKHREALSDYATSKGAIRFQPDRPLPASLVRALIVDRMEAIDAAESRRRASKSGRANPGEGRTSPRPR